MLTLSIRAIFTRFPVPPLALPPVDTSRPSCQLSPVGRAAPFAQAGSEEDRDVKGILGRLFGGGGSSGGAAGEGKPGDAVEHNGFRIRPAPYQSGGQFQTAGVIEKDFPDGTKQHKFIRAETHGNKDDAAAFAIAKGRQIIDERGDKIFEGK
jgi:hypothetical protein